MFSNLKYQKNKLSFKQNDFLFIKYNIIHLISWIYSYYFICYVSNKTLLLVIFYNIKCGELHFYHIHGKILRSRRYEISEKYICSHNEFFHGGLKFYFSILYVLHMCHINVHRLVAYNLEERS